MCDVTSLLSSITKGDPHAASHLLPLVYDELRRLASQWLAQEAPGQTLQPTALVHEAYVRLTGTRGRETGWDSRRHLFAAAAESMRRILVENAGRKQRCKHGGDAPCVAGVVPAGGVVALLPARLAQHAQPGQTQRGVR